MKRSKNKITELLRRKDLWWERFVKEVGFQPGVKE